MTYLAPCNICARKISPYARVCPYCGEPEPCKRYEPETPTSLVDPGFILAGTCLTIYWVFLVSIWLDPSWDLERGGLWSLLRVLLTIPSIPGILGGLLLLFFGVIGFFSR